MSLGLLSNQWDQKMGPFGSTTEYSILSREGTERSKICLATPVLENGWTQIIFLLNSMSFLDDRGVQPSNDPWFSTRQMEPGVLPLISAA